jgi:hypothetical protein
MWIAAMKPINEGREVHCMQATMPMHIPHHGFDETLYMLATVVLWVVGIALLLALYAVMFAAIYRWSQYSPMFPLDSSISSSTTEVV